MRKAQLLAAVCILNFAFLIRCSAVPFGMVQVDANGYLQAPPPLPFFQTNLFPTNVIPSSATYSSGTYSLSLVSGAFYYFQSASGDQATLHNGSQTIVWPMSGCFVASGGSISLSTGNSASGVSSMVLGRVMTNYGKFIGDFTGNINGPGTVTSATNLLGTITGSQITSSHSVPDSVLSTNVALMNGVNYWGGTDYFGNEYAMTMTVSNSLSALGGLTVGAVGAGYSFSAAGTLTSGAVNNLGGINSDYGSGTYHFQTDGSGNAIMKSATIAPQSDYGDNSFTVITFGQDLHGMFGHVPISISWDNQTEMLELAAQPGALGTLGAAQSVNYYTLAGNYFGWYRGDGSQLTNGDATTFFSSGLVPAQFLGTGTSNPNAVLGRDGTWHVLSGSGTVTSVGFTGDGTLFATSVSGSPVTTTGTFAPQPANASANTFIAGPTSGSAAPLSQRGIVDADINGLDPSLNAHKMTNASANLAAFGVQSAHDAVTNFWIDFSGAPYQQIMATADICFTIPTNGPGAVSVMIQPNGANRNILWPTNYRTLNTNGLVINGTNYQMTLTNGGRVAYCSFVAYTNGPADTNVVAMLVCSP
jgi:hypothetical protein